MASIMSRLGLSDKADLSIPRGAAPMTSLYDADAFGRFSEGLARFMGTGRYLVSQTVFVILWIVLNGLAFIHHWDPYPYILLNLAFSTQAAYAAPLILLAQNRQDERDRAVIERDREVAARTQADTEYLARELASVRLALDGVVTGEEFHDALARLEKLIVDQRPVPEARDHRKALGVAARELVVLGTASQAPTRTRNHNGYFLRWDASGLLFDPGEGTQRQMLLAGVTASQIGWVCITHFHGDHCLGLPGVLQRMALDQVTHEVQVAYPAASAEFFPRLRHAALFRDTLCLAEHPIGYNGTVATGEAFTLEARALSHRAPAFGYRLTEPDGRRMRPDLLVANGISGSDIGRLQKAGKILHDGRVVALADVSEPRAGQKFAFVMDTRLCDAAFQLADGVDMLVCESTFGNADLALANEYGHLTAGQAGRIAAEAGVRLLVLTHFSQRYGAADLPRLAAEAGSVFGGEIVVANDLDRIPVPRRSR